MKAKYLSLAALALMGTLASCQSDDEATVSSFRPDNAVSLNFSVGSLQGITRSNAAATDDTQRWFNQGDQISVSTNDQEAVVYQCTSSDEQTWTEAVAGKFLLWTQNTLTFSAYYPVTTGTSMTAFTMPTDQSSVDKIALADYMTKTDEIERPEGGSNIQMQLERKMARVIVRISGFGSQYFDDQKTVSNVRIYSQASGIANSSPTGSSPQITPYAQGNGGPGSTYTALVVPGNGNSSANFVTLTDGESTSLHVNGIPEMQAGYSYTYNLTVGKNKIEVASVTVQDWTTSETLTGGQATEQGGAAAANIYANVTDATAASETAVAMIAYVGNASDCTNGLAIALADESDTKGWSAAGTACSGKTAVTGGTWRLPSIQDWQYMFIGCGASGTVSDTPSSMSFNGLASKLSTAEGTALLPSSYYWSSTERSANENAWSLLTDGNNNVNFRSDAQFRALHVRACLAF